MKRKILFGVVFILCIILVGCNTSENHENDQYQDDSMQYRIYQLAYSSGYIGTYEEWLNSISGKDGLTTELRVADGYIQWKYTTEEDNFWKDLISLNQLAGESGANGKEVTFQVVGNYIQWQYIGDTSWNNLIDLSVLTGKNGSNGREVTFRVAEGYIQWQYVGDIEWTNLVDLDTLKGDGGQNQGKIFTVTYITNGGVMPKDYEEVTSVLYGETIDLPIPTKEGYTFAGWYTGFTAVDGKFTNVTPVTRNIVLQASWQENKVSQEDDYAFNEFVLLDSPVLAYSQSLNGKSILKYKIGTLYYVPIAYGFAQQLFAGSAMTLSYSLEEATTETIEHAVSIAETNTASIGVEVGIKDIVSIGGNTSHSITVEEMYSVAKSQSTSNTFSGSYTISSANFQVGKYYRIAIVTNIDYYVYFECDASSQNIEQYLATEYQTKEGKYVFSTKIQESDSMSFETLPFTPESYTYKNITLDRLTADGIYEITDSTIIYTGTFFNSDEVAPSFYTETQYLKQIFNYDKQYFIKKGIYNTIKLDYTFYFFKKTNDSIPLDIVISNEKFCEAPLSPFPSIIYSTTIETGIGNRYQYTSLSMKGIEINLNDINDQFYIYILPSSGKEITIKDQLYEYTIEPDKSKIKETISYTRSDTKTSTGRTLSDSPDYSVNDIINIKVLSGFSVDEYMKLGYTKLTVTFSFVCSKSKYGFLDWHISNTLNNSVLVNPIYQYDDNTFLSTYDSITTMCTGSFTIDLHSITDDTIYFIWGCMVTNSYSGTSSTSNLNITLNMSK